MVSNEKVIKNMKIALASARIVDGDIQSNLNQMKRYMKLAHENNADLVCFGEAFLQGFNALAWNYEIDQHIAISVSSKEFEIIKKMTCDLNIDVLFGYNELDEDTIYSSCALISNGVIVHNYRRISRGWKEYTKTDQHYKEGHEVPCFEYKGLKCCIALCGDLWDYPERFSLNEDLLFWPVYVNWTEEEWYNGGKAEYAHQASLCSRNTLYINSICDGDAFGGSIHFYDGQVQGEVDIMNEGFQMIDI